MQYPPQSSQRDLPAFNRFIKILYFVLFATVGLYWVVLEILAAAREPVDTGLMKTGLLAAAGVCAGIVLYLRFSRISSLLVEPSVDAALRIFPLRFYYILCYTLAEAVALYGFVLRLLGGSREDVIPFFLAAVLLFLLCYPRLPQVPGSP